MHPGEICCGTTRAAWCRTTPGAGAGRASARMLLKSCPVSLLLPDRRSGPPVRRSLPRDAGSRRGDCKGTVKLRGEHSVLVETACAARRRPEDETA